MTDRLVNTQQLIETDNNNATNNNLIPEVDNEPITRLSITELIQKFERIISENKKKEEKPENNSLEVNETDTTTQQSENSIQESLKASKNEGNLVIKEDVKPEESAIEKVLLFEQELDVNKNKSEEHEAANENNQDMLIVEEPAIFSEKSENKEILPKEENDESSENLKKLEITEERAIKEKESNAEISDLTFANENALSHKKTEYKDKLPKEESNIDSENLNQLLITKEKAIKEKESNAEISDLTFVNENALSNEKTGDKDNLTKEESNIDSENHNQLEITDKKPIKEKESNEEVPDLTFVNENVLSHKKTEDEDILTKEENNRDSENHYQLLITKEKAIKEKEPNEEIPDLTFAAENAISQKKSEDEDILPKEENNRDSENPKKLEITEERAIKEKVSNEEIPDLTFAAENAISQKKSEDEDILPKEENNRDSENPKKLEITDERAFREKEMREKIEKMLLWEELIISNGINVKKNILSKEESYIDTEDPNKIEITDEKAIKEKKINKKVQEMLNLEDQIFSYRVNWNKEILPKEENYRISEDVLQVLISRRNTIKENKLNEKIQDLPIVEEPNSSYKKTEDKEILTKEENNEDSKNHKQLEVTDKKESNEKSTSNNHDQSVLKEIYSCPIITAMFAKHKEREEREKKYGIVKRTYTNISRKIKEFFGCSNRNERKFYERYKV